MPAATDATGVLRSITSCTISIPGVGDLNPRIIPDITDNRSVTYADEPGIGRSFPIKTFGHGDNRTITMNWHIVIVDDATKFEAVEQLHAFQSCTYPTNGTPYAPPPICTIDCGEILTGGTTPTLCVVLKSYSVTYPTDVAWDEELMIPYKFDINLVWETVYATPDLPGQDNIIGS